jgi:Xaa-Pro dipeptidase
VSDRVPLVQEALAGAALGGAILVQPANMAYVGGFRPTPWERLIALVVPGEGPARLVVPSLEEEAARAAVIPGTRLHVWRDEEGPEAALAAALEGLEGPIGIEKAHLSVARSELVAAALPRAEQVDCGPLLGGLRLAKDDGELALLRRAGEIVSRAVDRLAAEVQPGRSELDLAARAGELIREEGASGLAFPPVVLGGASAALPHGGPTPAALREGDLVIVDVGAEVDGYCSDITRTYVCGREPDERQRELVGVVREAQAAAIDATRAGVTGAEVDRAARSVIEEAGLGERFVHRTGHGLGLEPHEPPSLDDAAGEPLPAGAVVTVEPGVYLPGYGGVRIEDDVVVRSGGAELLTTANP